MTQCVLKKLENLNVLTFVDVTDAKLNTQNQTLRLWSLLRQVTVSIKTLDLDSTMIKSLTSLLSHY